MQSIYTSGTSNYSMANLYKSAGTVNIMSSYLPQNSSSSYVDAKGNTQTWAGDNICGPAITHTSSVVGYVGNFPNSLNTIVYSQSSYVGIDEKPLAYPSAPSFGVKLLKSKNNN